MANPVNGAAGPSGDRAGSPVDAALEARVRRAERARLEERAAEPQRVGSGPPGSGVDAAAAAGTAEPIRPYRVTLDPKTSHLYTEVLDTDTGEVVLRIPSTYVEPEDAAGTAAEGEDASGGKGSLEA